MSASSSSAVQLSDLLPICKRLPSVSVDQLIGAAKILSRAGGTLPPRALAAALSFNDEQLAAVVEFLSSLGLVEMKDHHLVLTAVGKRIASAGIAARKRLFSELILRLPLVKSIVDRLAAEPERSLPRDKLLEDLGAEACASDADRIFNHVLSWGRYAELFSYDASSGRVFLT
jgi:NitT/TauT family transport system ATP-binding protein